MKTRRTDQARLRLVLACCEASRAFRGGDRDARQRAIEAYEELARYDAEQRQR